MSFKLLIAIRKVPHIFCLKMNKIKLRYKTSFYFVKLGTRFLEYLSLGAEVLGWAWYYIIIFKPKTYMVDQWSLVLFL